MFRKKDMNKSPSMEEKPNKESILPNSDRELTSGNSFFTRIYGLIFICLGIIGFSNSSFLGIGSFICYIFVYVFGVFSYFALGGLILLGLFLSIKGKWPKFRINFSNLGWIFIILFGTLVASISIDNLTLPTFLDIHNANMNAISSSNMHIDGINLIPHVYGGFLGDLLAALFITGTGMVGAKIFSYIFLIFGIILVVRPPFVALYLWMKQRRVSKMARAAEKRSKKEQEKIKQLKEGKVTSTKHVNPFEETKYEDHSSGPRPISAAKDKNQENDISLSKSTPLSPMMTEYPYDLYKERRSERNKNQKEEVAVEKNIDSKSAAEVFDGKDDKGDTEGEKIERNKADGDHSNFLRSIEKAGTSESKNNEDDLLKRNDDNYYSSMKIGKTSDSTGQTSDLEARYPLPSLDLLSTYSETRKDDINEKNAQRKIPIIDNVFKKFNIGAHVDSYTIGPSVTRFNIRRDNGVKISVFSSNNIQQEIAADLRGDMSVRIEAVVKGQSTSGVEVANEAPTLVSFKECMEQIVKSDNKLLIPFGENISSEVICASLDKLPHLLVSGTTGSGKSVFIHAIIMTLIMRNYPEELKLILIDPKQVEFARYRDIPHLYCPIISNINKAVTTLKKLVAEMERRYTILSRCEVNKIEEYNKMKLFHPEYENLPNLVCIIDEFADLMGQDAKNVDALTQRLTQKARAAGIYLIIATQRPSVKCITGTIKANIPARVALSLPTYTDSRTILDEGGAEVLIGKGDLLARIPASFKSTIRLQSAFVSNEEISSVVNYLRSQAMPVFNPNFLNIDVSKESEDLVNSRHLSGYDDELYDEIKKYVMTSNIASTSDLQRRFSIGYGRAAAIFDALEDEGIVVTLKPSNRKQVVKHIDSLD